MHPRTFILAVGMITETAVLLRVMLRPHREPASRIAWVAVIGGLPFLGIIAYMLFGEVNIGRRRIAKLRAIERSMPTPELGAGVELVNLRIGFQIATNRCLTSADPSADFYRWEGIRLG